MRAVYSTLAAAALLGTAAPASAGWDNVFQVCCNDCRPRPIASYYAPACPTPCPPQPQARVEYRQRSYYEPITVMKPERFVEAIPEQRKSFYYEPVTSYSYSSYYDPCTCTCQQIAVPRTSYRLREQCNTVMRYVERIRMVPSQSQRLVTETQPVVTYYYPPTKAFSAPADPCPPGAAPAPAAPQVESIPGAGPSVIPESTAIPPQALPTTPGTSYRRPTTPAPQLPARSYNARTTSRSNGAVRGEVVLNDRETPRAGAKLVFVNAADTNNREYVTADAFGHFDAKLPAGDWYLYLGNGAGRAEYHKQISVGELDSRDFKVVSR